MQPVISAPSPGRSHVPADPRLTPQTRYSPNLHHAHSPIIPHRVWITSTTARSQTDYRPHLYHPYPGHSKDLSREPNTRRLVDPILSLNRRLCRATTRVINRSSIRERSTSITQPKKCSSFVPLVVSAVDHAGRVAFCFSVAAGLLRYHRYPISSSCYPLLLYHPLFVVQ